MLLTGVAMLIGCAALLIMTLYGRIEAPQPFKSETSITLALAQGAVSVPLPPHINQAANLSVFLMAVLILAGIGVKIGRLGVQLIQKPQPPQASSPK